MKAKRRCAICDEEPTMLVAYTWATAGHSRRMRSERCDRHYRQLVGVRDAGRIAVRIHGVASVVFAG